MILKEFLRVLHWALTRLRTNHVDKGLLHRVLSGRPSESANFDLLLTLNLHLIVLDLNMLAFDNVYLLIWLLLFMILASLSRVRKILVPLVDLHKFISSHATYVSSQDLLILSVVLAIRVSMLIAHVLAILLTWIASVTSLIDTTILINSTGLRYLLKLHLGLLNSRSLPVGTLSSLSIQQNPFYRDDLFGKVIGLVFEAFERSDWPVFDVFWHSRDKWWAILSLWVLVVFCKPYW